MFKSGETDESPTLSHGTIRESWVQVPPESLKISDMNWMNEKEKLIDLVVKNNQSYESVGRLYGVSGAAIKKQCKKLGVSLKSRRKINPKETFNRKYVHGVFDEEKQNIEESDFLIHKNFKNIGEIGERIAIGELAKFGIDVLLPMSDNLPFDFVVFHNNKFYKCQVKTTSKEKNGILGFSLTSNNWNKGTVHKYTKEEIDVVICCDLNTIYLFRIEDVIDKTYLYLRNNLPKNRQIKKVHFALDYKISSQVLNQVFK